MPRIAWLRSHSASVVSSIAALEATPALETTMSTPPNASTAAANAAADGLLGGDVAAHADPVVAELGDRLRGALAVEVEADHARAGGGQRVDDRAADAAGRAGDQRDLALQLARRRRQRELVELERPVLDREALALVSDVKPPSAWAPAITSIARW